MITHADAEMLQNAIQNTGGDILKRRALDQQHQQEMARLAIDSQMRDIQGKRYEAQAAHFQNMEDVGSERNAILAQTEADRTKIFEQGKLAAQQYGEAQTSLKEFAQTLRSNRIANQQDPSKGLSHDDATKAFQQAMDALPPQIHQQMLQNPNYGSLYKGVVDFSTIPMMDKNGNPVEKQPPTLSPTGNPKFPGALTPTGKYIPPTAATAPDPVRNKLAADAVKASLPLNHSPTNAPYAMGQYDKLTGAQPAATSASSLDPTAIQRQVGVTPSAPAVPAAAVPGAGSIKPPAAHIAYLQAHPEAAADFEAKYGPGSSAQYLNPQ